MGLRIIAAIVLSATVLSAQGVLAPSFDSRTATPGRDDNSELLIVQPSRHGNVTFAAHLPG